MNFEEVEDETPIDISHLVNRSQFNNRAEINLAESENIAKAYLKYLSAKPTPKTAPFDFQWLLKLHREMFCEVWTFAGKTRQTDLNIGTGWFNINTELQSLVDDIRFWVSNQSFSTAEIAMRIHHKAVKIHPFLNGNGRWSRMLSNIFLKQNAEPITEWPESIIGTQSEIRDAYIKAIKLADKGKYDPLFALQSRYTNS